MGLLRQGLEKQLDRSGHVVLCYTPVTEAPLPPADGEADKVTGVTISWSDCCPLHHVCWTFILIQRGFCQVCHLQLNRMRLFIHGVTYMLLIRTGQVTWANKTVLEVMCSIALKQRAEESSAGGRFLNRRREIVPTARFHTVVHSLNLVVWVSISLRPRLNRLDLKLFSMVSKQHYFKKVQVVPIYIYIYIFFFLLNIYTLTHTGDMERRTSTLAYTSLQVPFTD